MTLEKAKQIRKAARKIISNDRQRKNLQKELAEIEKTLKESKKKYFLIKEFNGWSQALGWAKFEEIYNKSQTYIFEEYIEDKIFATPSPWVKKLANMGDIRAANEMFRREAETKQAATEAEEKAKNQNRLVSKRKKEHLEWQENGRKNGEIDL